MKIQLAGFAMTKTLWGGSGASGLWFGTIMCWNLFVLSGVFVEFLCYGSQCMLTHPGSSSLRGHSNNFIIKIIAAEAICFSYAISW